MLARHAAECRPVREIFPQLFQRLKSEISSVVGQTHRHREGYRDTKLLGARRVTTGRGKLTDQGPLDSTDNNS